MVRGLQQVDTDENRLGNFVTKNHVGINETVIDCVELSCMYGKIFGRMKDVDDDVFEIYSTLKPGASRDSDRISCCAHGRWRDRTFPGLPVCCTFSSSERSIGNRTKTLGPWCESGSWAC